MIEFDRIEKLRERRLSGTGAGNTQVTPSSFSDTKIIDKVKEERLNRIATVAQTDFAPQSQVKKKENSDVVPNKDASWWGKTSDFIKEYFKPTEQVRARDVIREVPGAILSVGKDIARSPVTVPTKVLTTLTGQKQYTPETSFEKFLVGDNPVESYTSDAESVAKFAEEKGLGKGSSVAVGGLAASGEVLLDLATGGKGKAVKEVVKATTEQGARYIIEKFGAKATPELIERVIKTNSEDAAEAVVKELSSTKRVFSGRPVGSDETNSRYQFFTESEGRAKQYAEVNQDVTGASEVVDDNINPSRFKEVPASKYMDELENPETRASYDGVMFKEPNGETAYARFNKKPGDQIIASEDKALVDEGIASAKRNDIKLKQKAEAAADISDADGTAVPSVRKLLSNRAQSGVEAQNKVINLRGQIDEAPENIFKHQAGEDYRGRSIIDDEFRALREEAEKRLGVKIEERKNYLPGVYRESQPKIREAVVKKMKDGGATEQQIKEYLDGGELDSKLANSLKMNPFFADGKYFQNYAEAGKYGLNPKFEKMSELVAHYKEELGNVVAERQFVDDLIKDKIITTKPGGSMEAVNLPGHKGDYFAKPKDAAYLNDYFRNEEALRPGEKFFKATGTGSRKLQEVVLSGAMIPKTNVNFLTIGLIDKELKTAIGSAATLSVRKALTHLKAVPHLLMTNVTPLARKWFEKRFQNGIAMKMAKEGIDITKFLGNYKEYNRGFANFFKKSTMKDIFGDGFARLFGSDKSFNGFLNMRMVSIFEDTYKAGIKKGLSEEVASKLAGDTTKKFMGLIDNVKTPGKEDMLSTVFFAPKYRESLIQAYWNMAKSVSPHTWKDPAYANSRRLFIGSVIVGFGFYDAMNKKLNGHHMWENPIGKKTELMIPGEDGKVYYVPFAPSQLAFFRNMVEASVAAVKGDSKVAIQKIGSNASIGAKLLTDIVGNEDYFGNQIYDPQAPILEQIKAVAEYVGLNANHPYVKGAWNLAKDANAESQKIYPTYQRISKLLDQGKREEATRAINALSPEDKQAYYDMRKQKLKPLPQILSEMGEVPLRFSSKGKIASAEYYKKVDDIAREVKKLPEGEERTAKIQEVVASTPEAERRSLLNSLVDAGVSTKGVSISEDIIRMKPTYQKVQELVAAGKEKEARAIVDKLSDENYKAYKKVRSAAIAAKTKSEKEQMRAVYDNVQELLTNGKESEARKIVDGLTDREYEVYKLLKDE